jgi:ligand-binding sensor domain-containing protein
MIRAFYLALSILIILPSQKYPQVKKPFGTMPFRHYTTSQGLVGSNVFAFHQDKKGYIWFATSSGLSRFDGNDFNNFTTSEGLVSNNLTGVDCNSGDSLIITTYDKGINVFYNGKFSKYKITNSNTPLIHHLIVDNNHLFIYADYLTEIYQNKITNRITNKYRSIKRVNQGFQITDATKLKNGDLLFASFQGIIRVTNSGELYNESLPAKKIITSVCQAENGDVWFGGYGEIWIKRNGNYRQVFKDIKIPRKYPIQNLLVDTYNNVWLSLANGNLYLIKDNKIINIGTYLKLQNTQVNFIKKDKDGNIWVGTFGKGLFCFFNLSVTNYSSKDNLSNDYVLSLGEDPAGRILIGTFNGLNIIDNNQISEIPTGFAGAYHYIRDIEKSTNNKIYVAIVVEIKNNFDEKYVLKNIHNIPYRIFPSSSCYPIDDNYVYFGGWDNKLYIINLLDYDNNLIKEIKVFPNISQKVRINKITLDKKGTIWLATTGGLCKINGEKQFYYKDNPLLNANINDVKINGNGNVWVAGDLGVARLADNKWENITQYRNINLNTSTSIAFDNNNNVWIGNSKGLFKIKNDSISYYSGIMGLDSFEINAILYDSLKNDLWVGTVDGLSKIDLKLFNRIKTIIPNVYIEEVRNSDTTYNVSPSLELPDFDQKKITIKFSAINFRNPGNLVFEYKNGNDNSDWEITDQTEIQFASLYPGNNTIYIRARDLNGVWSKPAQISLHINTPFLKSYWFYTLVMIALFIPASFITREIIEKRQQKILEKRDIEKRIIELKHQAMSAMMNPHFIFNSLNSIQNFINNHSKKEANLYLSNFSKLIRLNLDLAQNSFVNLKEELDRLTLYLNLEKMRFGDGFNYSINIDEAVNASEIMIPNMVIQPFVENGIWHGILPNNKIGQLNVAIKYGQKKDLIIEIVDDGIGYFESQNIKKSAHVSKGISIIKERLNLLNKDKNRTDLVQIDSSYDENSISKGTSVQIILHSDMYSFETVEEFSDR